MKTSNVPQMKQIESKAVVCTDCPLSETRTQVVFGEGNSEATLVLVGEGPGDQEDKRGRPFVGKAGKLLDEVLVGAQIVREEIWLTNVIMPCLRY
jgi:DNA polymerase